MDETETLEQENGRPAAGFGAIIQAAREEQGISLGDMATRSRLSLSQLRAIESENVDQLPEPVYVRAFLRGVANVLRIDPEPILADYKARFCAEETLEHTIPERDPDCELVLRDASGQRGLKWILALLVIVVIGAGVWYVYQDFFTERFQQVEQTLAGNHADEQKVDLAQPPAMKDGEEKKEAAPASETAPATEAVKPAEATAADVKAEAAQTEESAAEAPAVPAVEPETKPVEPAALEKPVEKAVEKPAAKRADVVVLKMKTRADCWVQVKAPNGKVVFTRLMKAGEDVSVDAPKGSRMVVGDVDAIVLEADGKPFNLKARSSAGTARFTL